MTIANIADLRAAARRRLPKILFDYIDGGSFSESTARRNIDDFNAIQLEQRVLTGLPSARNLSVNLLGRKQSLPFALGPVGFSGLFAPQGEVLAARAAHKAGIPFCLSNFGMTTLDELRRRTDGPLWFQLYLITDRDLSDSFLERARRADIEALFVTVDCAVGGVRERDVRSGFRSIGSLTPGLILALLSHPRWCLDMLRAGIPRIGHLSDRPQFGSHALKQSTRLAGLVNSNVTWDDIRRVRDQWQGKLVVKGVLHPDDARQAAAIGADAIVVSNHGGRELDGAPSSIAVLSSIVSAVAGKTEILFDSGIRRGSDIVKALALGAGGVLLGRAYAYGLAADGERGVTLAIKLLETELDVTMSLMGIRSVRELADRRDQILHKLQSTA